MCLMPFLARFSYLKETRLISPDSLLSLLIERFNTLKCSNLDSPLAVSILLLLRYSSVSCSPSKPCIYSIWFSERSRTLKFLFLSTPLMAAILLELSLRTRSDLCFERSGMAAILLLLKSTVSKWRGIYFISKTDVSWFSLARIYVKYFNPLRYFKLRRLLNERSTF